MLGGTRVTDSSPYISSLITEYKIKGEYFCNSADRNFLLFQKSEHYIIIFLFLFLFIETTFYFIVCGLF